MLSCFGNQSFLSSTVLSDGIIEYLDPKNQIFLGNSFVMAMNHVLIMSEVSINEERGKSKS